MELRTQILDILVMWSFNGTTESESAESVADEIMTLVYDKISEAEHYAALEASERD